jgi:uncharacterized protein YbbK (DUF523 family)
MKRFPRSNVVVSNCLELSVCRYNGQVIHDDFVKKLSDHVNLVPVCPEVSIGLVFRGSPFDLSRKKRRSD